MTTDKTRKPIVHVKYDVRVGWRLINSKGFVVSAEYNSRQDAVDAARAQNTGSELLT